MPSSCISGVRHRSADNQSQARDSIIETSPDTTLVCATSETDESPACPPHSVWSQEKPQKVKEALHLSGYGIAIMGPDMTEV